jgi:hypothetical protein
MECPFCQGPIDGSNVDAELRVAKCSVCNTLFSFADLVVDQQGIGVFGGVRAEKLPRGMSIHDGQTGRRITDFWLSSEYVVSAIIVFFVDVVLALAIASGQWLTVDFWWQMTGGLVLLAFLAVTYVVVAGLFNRTLVEVADGVLVVKHEPLPWFGNRRILATDVLEVFLTSRNLTAGRMPPIITYNVNAGTRDGKAFMLLIDLPALTPALLCQLHLDKWLQLRDRGHDKEAGRHSEDAKSEAIMVREESYREKPHDA